MKSFLVGCFSLFLFMCVNAACLASGFEQYGYYISGSEEESSADSDEESSTPSIFRADLLNLAYIPSPFRLESPRETQTNTEQAAKIMGIYAYNDIYKDREFEDDSASSNSSSDIIHDNTLYYVFSRKGNLVQSRFRFGEQLHNDVEDLANLGYLFGE